jgi:3-methyladenine DNA glycosylase/8-oxoguanine DNA glycosylase
MAELVNAEPGLDPYRLFDRLPSDLWGALVLQVIGQQLSLAAAAAILTRLEALQGGRMPTPAELLATDAETLRGIGMSRAKAVYLHDIAARLEDGRLDLDRLLTLDDDGARSALTEVKGVGRFTADGVLMLALAGPTSGPPLTSRSAARSSGSGDSPPRRQSSRSTRSGNASGRGAPSRPRTSTRASSHELLQPSPRAVILNGPEFRSPLRHGKRIQG